LLMVLFINHFISGRKSPAENEEVLHSVKEKKEKPYIN